ncbi:MAG TPA: hypothetical protein VFV50_14405, partial [Bdellovibrionales bacterium]|nr:hypothetical protein [Bdellovibrionales bacterium]
IRALVTAYGEVNPSSPELETIRRQALEFLETASYNPKCYPEVAGNYVLGALTYLTRFDESKDPYLTRNGVTIEAPKQRLATLAIVMYNHGLIRFVTRKQRAHQCSLFFAQPGKQKILGGYDCVSAAMTVDPIQSPYDAAATLVHEMSHFYFDKGYFLEPLKDGKAMTLLDESMAALLAGYVQRDFMMGRSSVDEPSKISSDLNFYTRAGVLDSMWRKRTDLGWSFNHFVVLLEKVLFAEYAGEGYDLGEKLYDTLAQAYFSGGYPWESRVQSVLHTEKFGQEEARRFSYPHIFSYLSTKVLTDSVRFTSDLKQIEAFKRDRTLAPELSGDGGENSVLTSDGYLANFGLLMTYADRIATASEKMSRSCEVFLEQLKSTELDGYLGKTPKSCEPDSNKSGGEGGRPGGEGGRPGGEGGRPGGEGGRPGGEGGRPGGEGGRPGGEGGRPAIRPCVQIGDNL